jgi:hypothetical protein
MHSRFFSKLCANKKVQEMVCVPLPCILLDRKNRIKKNNFIEIIFEMEMM